MHVIMCTNCTLGLANFLGENVTNPTVKFGPKGECTQIFERHQCIFYHVTRAPKLAISRLFRLKLPSFELLGCSKICPDSAQNGSALTLTTVRDHILAQISGWSLKHELKRKFGRPRHNLDKTYHLGNIMHNSQICDKYQIQSSKVLALPLKTDDQEDFN